jgi:hypothetical protein
MFFAWTGLAQPLEYLWPQTPPWPTSHWHFKWVLSLIIFFPWVCLLFFSFFFFFFSESDSKMRMTSFSFFEAHFSN